MRSCALMWIASGPTGSAVVGEASPPRAARAICRPALKPSRYRFCSDVKSPDMSLCRFLLGRFDEAVPFVQELEHALAALQVGRVGGKLEPAPRPGHRRV